LAAGEDIEETVVGSQEVAVSVGAEVGRHPLRREQALHRVVP
jgi:hypothetical protein